MKHEVKVVVLPTVKASQIFKSIERELRFLDTPKSPKWGTNQHLYATVSQDVEPIKKGDWAMYLECATKKVPFKDAEPYLVTEIDEVHWNDRKIIATTDKSLSSIITKKDGLLSRLQQEGKIKSFLPQLQQSFLKEYVANPDGEWEVEYESIFNVKFKYTNNESPSKSILKLNQDNTVNITAVEEKMYSKSEVIKLCEIMFNEDFGVTWNGFEDWIKDNL
tara:strand:- start:1161 stop:1820 length:660 start_codon:yes stop_codon:yes gene_type:complete